VTTVVVDPLKPARTVGGRIRHLAWRALRIELGVWRSLYRFVFRRPSVPRGAAAFGYDKPIRTILIAFIVVSAIEVPIVDLIVHQWVFIRIPLLILGIWGLTFMVGMLLGYLTRPHAVGPAGIRVRHGDEVDIDLPWDIVAAVALRKHHIDTSKTFTIDGDVLAIAVQDETQLLITLEQPIEVHLPSGARVSVTALRISADDPRAFMDAVREHIDG
jgi:hypothetical protein